MLDLLQSREAACERCGNVRQCAHVVMWDGSFNGWICWIELMKLVNEVSKDPEHRKKQAWHRVRRVTKAAPGGCHCDRCCGHCAEKRKDASRGLSWSCSCPCCSGSWTEGRSNNRCVSESITGEETVCEFGVLGHTITGGVAIGISSSMHGSEVHVSGDDYHDVLRKIERLRKLALDALEREGEIPF